MPGLAGAQIAAAAGQAAWGGAMPPPVGAPIVPRAGQGMHPGLAAHNAYQANMSNQLMHMVAQLQAQAAAVHQIGVAPTNLQQAVQAQVALGNAPPQPAVAQPHAQQAGQATGGANDDSDDDDEGSADEDQDEETG